MKLWVCGITQNREKDIEELTRDLHQHVDGLIFVDGGSTDNTVNILNSRCGKGKTLYRKWTNDHDFQMNEFLRAGIMRNGDWFLILDSPERVNPEFSKELRRSVEFWEQSGISGVYFDRIYLAKYSDDMFFAPNPHWGLHNIKSKVVQVPEKSKFITNTRTVADSGFLHGVKYFYVYGRSNECQLIYGKYGIDIVNRHEASRIAFRNYCESVLEIELTLDSLEEYFNRQKFTNDFINYVDQEFRLTDFFRFKVLKQPILEVICKNRYNWSFRKFLETGDQFQYNNSNYIGTLDKYNHRFGFPKQD